MAIAGRNKFHLLFCDESRTTKAQFRLFGGVVIDRSDRSQFIDDFATYRARASWSHEFKWQEVNKRSLPVYIGLVDLFFDYGSRIFFKSLVVDRNQVIKGWHDPDTRFFIEYYQLLVHSFGKYHTPDNKALVTLHRMSTKYSLSEVKRFLGIGMAAIHLRTTPYFLNVESDEATHNPFIQIVDVLLGAVGYEINNLHLADNASPAKIALVKHIQKRAGLKTFVTNTPPWQHKFCIWLFNYTIKR